MGAISGLIEERSSIAEALVMSQRLSDYVTVQEDGCVFWTSAKSRGYGQARWLRTDGSKGTALAHRMVYEAVHGPLPADIVLDHVCHDPETCRSSEGLDCPHRSCVNPDHLRPVTTRDNNLRSITPPALNAVKTHCKNGHEFDEENTYRPPTGGRQCRICRDANVKNYRLRRAAARSVRS